MKGHPEMRSNYLQLSYYLKDKERFKADYMIINQTATKLRFTLIVLIDYIQREFIIEEKEKVLSYAVSLLPYEKIILPITITDMGKGAHDFLLIAHRDSTLYNSFDYRKYPILFYRANIFVDSDETPQVVYSKYPQYGSKLHSIRITINKSSTFNKFNEINYSLDLMPEDNRFYLHINNPHKTAVSYAIVLFSNHLQTYIKDGNNKQRVIYHALGPERQSIIDCEVNLNKDTHILWVLLIENPYTKIESKLESGISEMTTIPTYLVISNIVQFQDASR